MTSESKIRVLIAHREPLVAAGLEATFSSRAEFEIVERAGPLAELTAEVARLRAIDVVLSDCATGVQLARSDRAGRYRVLIVTQDETEASIRRAMEAGVRGYLLLASTLESIVLAVFCVVRGGTALDPVAATKMLDSLKGTRITKREMEVLSLLMHGMSDKAIAQRLGISSETSKCHVKRLLTKLDAGSRTEAVAIAQRRGIVSPEPIDRGPPVPAPRQQGSSVADMQSLRGVARRPMLPSLLTRA